VEGLSVAHAIQENLDHDAEVTVWTQGIFELSRTTLSTLVEAIDQYDFAVFVLTPDDIVTMRDDTRRVARDNVIFELGLFIGGIGECNTFIVHPRGISELHLPTDLLGVTPATYDPDRSDKNLIAAVGAACNQIRRSVKGVSDDVLTSVAPPVSSTVSFEVDRASQQDLDADLGFLELSERMESHFLSASKIMVRLAGQTETMTKKIESSTKKINSAGADGLKKAELKRSVNGAAREIKTYSFKLDKDTPSLLNHLQAGLTAMSRLIATLPPMCSTQTELDPLIMWDGLLKNVRIALTTATKQTNSLLQAMNALPRITLDMNRAREAVSKSLRELTRVLGSQSVILDAAEANVQSARNCQQSNVDGAPSDERSR